MGMVYFITLLLYYILALKSCSSNTSYSSAANTLTSALYNIRCIATHFMPKIDAYCSSIQAISLSPEQVKCLYLAPLNCC